MNKNNQPISFIGRINDIVKKDSNYIVKIKGEFSEKELISEILISREQFQGILKKLDSKLFSREGCFIIIPTAIKSTSMLTIDSEISHGETNDDDYTNLTYDFGSLLLFKGEMVAYYLYKKLEEDDE